MREHVPPGPIGMLSHESGIGRLVQRLEDNLGSFLCCSPDQSGIELHSDHRCEAEHVVDRVRQSAQSARNHIAHAIGQVQRCDIDRLCAIGIVEWQSLRLGEVAEKLLEEERVASCLVVQHGIQR